MAAMIEFLKNVLRGKNPPLAFPCKGAGFALLFCALLYTLGATCDTVLADVSSKWSANRMSDIWRDEFPVRNVGMAPPTFDAAKAVPAAGVLGRQNRPHPAGARVNVPQKGGTAVGSGTLMDVRGKFGMVITNWHVVRDATETIEVVFPDGFSSKARAIKVDSDWDLAALVIWRPSVEPVSIATNAPQPGDTLTICGYGQGNYRCATGRCTQYYAPRQDFPRHMVELDVEARQGDSGGPIFNQQGELAGVLFGAGKGTTLGSFGGRVNAFLASLAPDIGQAEDALAKDESAQPALEIASLPMEADKPAASSATLRPHQAPSDEPPSQAQEQTAQIATAWPDDPPPESPPGNEANLSQTSASSWQPTTRENLFEKMKTVLAAIG